MFCKITWNGIHILPDGYIRLCSLGQIVNKELDMQRCRDKDGNVMHILTHSISEIMNSDKHREVRLHNLQHPNEWSPHCECCENRERITGFNRAHKNKSWRCYLMNIDDNDVVSEDTYQDNKADAEGRVDWMPSSLDIRFGNLCNQRCIMCNPTFSNLWYEEYHDYYNHLTFGNSTKITVTKDATSGKWIEPPELQWFEDPRWWVKFETMMPHLKHIYITGGEPMVTPAHDIMLDKLIEAGYAKNIWLEYDTNCSAINDKIANRWFHFSRVDIRGSMDAINDQYEIIRYPGNWNRFQKNVKKLKEYEKSSNGKIRLIALTSCFQISTMYSIIESEEWCNSIGVNFHIRFLEGPAHHSTTSLSADAKLELIKYYQGYVTTSEKASLIINHLQDKLKSNISRPEAVLEFIKFMDYLDIKRGVNWRKFFPKVLEQITK
jgi:organic radical activating enzyme